MPLTARNIAMILLSAFIFGMGIGAVTAPKPQSGRTSAAPVNTTSPTPDVQALGKQPSEEAQGTPESHRKQEQSRGTGAATPTTPPSTAAAQATTVPPTPIPTTTATTTAPRGPSGLSAAADKQTAAPYESVTIRGQLSPPRSGVTLVVQRLKDGQWSGFPAQTTTSSSGSYQVTVSSGQAGENVFRVVWRGRNVVSNEVRITTAPGSEPSVG